MNNMIERKIRLSDTEEVKEFVIPPHRILRNRKYNPLTSL